MNACNKFIADFSGPLPPCISSRLPALRQLRLEVNQLNGTVPAGMCQGSPLLSYLSLRSNDFEGELNLAGCSNLVSLNVGYNR